MFAKGRFFTNNNSDNKAGFPRSDIPAMTGRERVLRALSYKKVDRVPVDLGGTVTSGAHVSVSQICDKHSVWISRVSR